MPARTQPPTLGQRLHGIAVALGVPAPDLDAMLARAAARTDGPVVDDGISVIVPAALSEQLEGMASRVGVPVQVLAAFIVDVGLTRRDAQARGERWPGGLPRSSARRRASSTRRR